MSTLYKNTVLFIKICVPFCLPSPLWKKFFTSSFVLIVYSSCSSLKRSVLKTTLFGCMVFLRNTFLSSSEPNILFLGSNAEIVIRPLLGVNLIPSSFIVINPFVGGFVKKVTFGKSCWRVSLEFNRDSGSCGSTVTILVGDGFAFALNHPR